MHQADFEIEPFFLDGGHGSLFCLHLYPANTPPRGSILYLHPFAEEMHKSRRMASLQARRMAAQGYSVLQVDLTGCGDSAGDFADASWQIWLDDARRAHGWLASKAAAPIILWGLRTGASLAVDLARELSDIQQLILWQPVTNGDQYLNQFLRIKLASEMLGSGQSQNDTQSLRAKLQAGENIEVGGYRLSPAMASELACLNLSAMPPPCPVNWLELGALAADQPSPAGRRVVEEWRKHGVSVHTRTLAGDPFWLTQEITECAGLLEVTMP
ncbi:MAG: hydrolase 2, exosortase A system-associated [Gallionella sp.]|nr:hydrolase 2, exosortase A system-associated [Gallionella sp.]MDD4945574.1 hydrolase 2, exosortase A system-associated [Gallionella sp.]MDD5611585.1 hydrolase 2, exosortase A system-associated [Gallionella sp.]